MDGRMCEGVGCDLKKMCYRHTAKPSEYRQAYFIESPIKDGDCDYFWKQENECKHIKKLGSSCSLNNNCKFPKCEN